MVGESGLADIANESGEKKVCRAAKAVVEEVRQSDVCKATTKYIVRKILNKYKVLSHKKQKSFVSAKKRRILFQWVRVKKCNL